MVMWRRDNKQQQQRRRLVHGVGRGASGVFTASRRKIFRWLLMGLAFFAILPPLFFHFKLRSFQQMQLHRDLQRILGNRSSRVGHLSTKEIEELDTNHHLASKFHDLSIPSIEDALKLVSGSVRQVILDAKVGPPSFEKGLANDIISAVKKTKCDNCLVWAKSDSLVRDILKKSADIVVGYVVMMDPATGTRMNLLRMRGAAVVGVYHPLVDEKLVKVVHRRKKKVYAWTVDDEVSMQKMLLEKVDAVVTSNPTLFQWVMRDMRRECLEQGFSMSS